MNKDQLANELKQKIKPGIKPSKLKKPKNTNGEKEFSIITTSRQENTPASTPPASPLIEPLDKKTSQKHDQESILPSPSELAEQIKQLQKEVNYWATTAQTHLTNLQLTTAQLDQAELTIKDLQTKLSAKDKTIEDLQVQVKTTKEVKQEQNPIEIKTFLCSDCQQARPQPELSRVFGSFSFCLACSKKARLQAGKEKQPSPDLTNFTCHSCSQLKQEPPAKMKLDSTLTEYLICSSCRPTLKEFNEADLITDELWAKYPYSSASEILEKEFNIKKEEKW